MAATRYAVVWVFFSLFLNSKLPFWARWASSFGSAHFSLFLSERDRGKYLQHH